MLQFDPDREPGPRSGSADFTLYVEGPRDREILRAWAYRLKPTIARRILSGAVILGGRQPQRALRDFRRRGGGGAGRRGLCILDRDDGSADALPVDPEAGLEFFTWSRRHIESYLLVPAALRRALCLPESDPQFARIVAEHLPPAGDESAFRKVNAKRLLGPNGVFPRALGRSVPLSGVARATREHELHGDVHALFERLHRLLAGAAPAARAGR